MTETQILDGPGRASTEITLRDRVSTLTTTMPSGKVLGVEFTTVTEMLDFAQAMSKADSAVPPHLRGNVGNCLAIVVRAIEWNMSPFAVANLSYEVENRGVKRVAYESQLYHAVLEARGPFKDRLNYEILGAGDERRCRVWATLRGEDKPREFLSDTLGKLRPPRNEHGVAKGSPLWDKKPELQLFYNASRDFVRVWAPDVMAGLYTRDEMEEAEAAHQGPQQAKDVSPIRERLRGTENRDGFVGAEKVAQTIDAAISAARGGNADKPIPKEASGTAREAPSTDLGTASAVGAQPAPPSPSKPSDSRAAPAAEPAPAPDLTDTGPASGAPGGGGHSTPLASAAARVAPSDQDVAAARARGRADRSHGVKRSAVPIEWRGPDTTALALAWAEGWNEKPRDADAAGD